VVIDQTIDASVAKNSNLPVIGRAYSIEKLVQLCSFNQRLSNDHDEIEKRINERVNVHAFRVP
jgi:hypothetical protein